MRGKDIIIAKDTPADAYVDGNTELETGKFEVGEKAAAGATPEKTALPQSAPQR
jgi:hypothetical protein